MTYVVEDHDRNGQVSPGDVIVYTVTLVNRGSESAASLVVTDPIPLGSQFVLGSIRWNGEKVDDVDGYYSGPPRIQVTISSLGAGEGGSRQVVQFKTRIATGAEQVDSIRNEARVKADGVADFWLPAVDTQVFRVAAEHEAAPPAEQAGVPPAAAAEPETAGAASPSIEPRPSRGGMQDVHFALDSAEILPESYVVLDSIVASLAAEPGVYLLIAGHSDTRGGESGDLRLSQDRARAVKAYLVAKGVDEKRLETLGRGGADPVAASDTESGRSANRRVELVTFRAQ